jgi:hypothetical protein
MMKEKMTKEETVLHELFRRVYAVSTPAGDWDQLLENATTNERDQKEIPFDDYECEESVMQEIFESTMKEFKIPKWRRMAFIFEFWLGPSPRSKKN